jgi:hypothetical protein
MTRVHTVEFWLATLTIAALALCAAGSAAAVTHGPTAPAIPVSHPFIPEVTVFGTAGRTPTGKVAPAHPARILVAREHLATPGDVSPSSVGVALAPRSGAFAWGAAGIGVAFGIALCAAMAAAVIGARSLRSRTLSTH